MIPASNIVQVNPGVISSGGNPLSLNGVMVTNNGLLAAGAPMSFTSANSVKNYFGSASDEYAQAIIYFNGYDNSTVKPGTMWFMRFVVSDQVPQGRGGSAVGLTLTQIQALSGTVVVNVNGTVVTSSSINLSVATSFSDAADIINDAFTGGQVEFSWQSDINAFVWAAVLLTPGAGTTMGFPSGTIATGLKMTDATGAITSPGFDQDTPTTVMDRLVQYTQNWVCFSSMFEPILEYKTEFAEWANAQDQRYVYVAWDTDTDATENGNLTCFGVLAKEAEWNAVLPLYNTVDLASFVMGLVASIDFSRQNARITAAFKHQSGMADTVTDEQIAANLLENGYSFYGIYATANDDFSFLYNGQVSGQWKWLDTFVNQVYLNNQFQLALMSFLTQIPSIPYNQDGYNLIRLVMQDPINQFQNFGGLRAGVVLSEAQKAQINAAAGLDVASIIETQGYYLQILDPGAQARGLRQTPIINFWYTDGGAVQQITLASIDIM